MTSEEQIVLLHPTIQLPARDHLFRAAAEGIHIVVTQGFRSSKDQAVLWSQGRVTPGPNVRPGHPLGDIVTKAPPGSSWHEFGLAYDVAILVNGKATWPNDTKLWTRVGEIGEAVGLEWGGRWKTIVDLPHFQWTDGLTLAQARVGRRPVKGPFIEAKKESP
jgi:peptidoglycan L-alanyl-D-glutamate endopeptidase CwlK